MKTELSKKELSTYPHPFYNSKNKKNTNKCIKEKNNAVENQRADYTLFKKRHTHMNKRSYFVKRDLYILGT